ncbi:XRE family transcriptional regulator [Patescibacteria group bacterium]|nr:MAG: XRE family transcriptional regulator [Patescibacteria group bacterium]
MKRMKTDENKAKTIGQRIRAAREAAGYSQLDLAKALDFETATAISLIENDQRGVTAENLGRIASILKIDVDSLLGKDTKMDVIVALRAEKNISKQDREAIERIIEMAKRKGNAKNG